jgi:putative DNA primase/helicase
MDGPSNHLTDIAIVTSLALLSAPEYERVRKSKADELGWRASILDGEVEKARRQMRPDDDAMAPAFTDEALALTFSARHCDDLRYVAAWGRWYEWTGAVWKPDATLRTFNRARAICREASLECNDENDAASIASGRTIASVERLARYDRRHAATVEQWDADPWLLNTPGGVVDLRTGRMRHHRADDHMTKITAVAPGGDCPQWRAFLHKITNGDEERQTFLQRVAGYCLTGSTREHALFFGYGTGGNGKGVFLNTLTGLMNDYATIASMETFTASANDRHPTDLAMLRGARLVTAQETEEGRKWAESKIKAMTGGDPITARFMRQDFFTYMPNFKLFIAGNHKPGLRSVDEAIRRRMNLFPFDVKIPPGERDAELPEKLKAEWPGILKWMIAGCLEWQLIRLAAPKAVTDATKEYFDTEDALGLWLLECCQTGSNDKATSRELFASWTQWTARTGEYTGTLKRFSQNLIARGFKSDRNNRGAGFIGVSLRSPPPKPNRSPAEPPEPDSDDPGFQADVQGV